MKCLEECKKRQLPCKNTDCRNWVDYSQDLNCCLLSIDKSGGGMTLVETAKRLGVSHVRVKQIQDKAIKKINTKFMQEDIY